MYESLPTPRKSAPLLTIHLPGRRLVANSMMAAGLVMSQAADGLPRETPIR